MEPVDAANAYALLVIDVLEGGTGDALYDAPVAAFAENCARIVKACREHDIPVIFCDDAHEPSFDRELELWGDHGIARTPESEPAKILGRADTDIIIPKRRYSGFFGTDLDLTLRELGAKTLIAIGCDTNICVLQTLSDAYNLAYDSIVVSDATRTFLIGTQEYALEYCRKCFGSTVLTTEETLEMIGL